MGLMRHHLRLLLSCLNNRFFFSFFEGLFEASTFFRGIYAASTLQTMVIVLCYINVAYFCNGNSCGDVLDDSHEKKLFLHKPY